MIDNNITSENKIEYFYGKHIRYNYYYKNNNHDIDWWRTPGVRNSIDKKVMCDEIIDIVEKKLKSISGVFLNGKVSLNFEIYTNLDMNNIDSEYKDTPINYKDKLLEYTDKKRKFYGFPTNQKLLSLDWNYTKRKKILRVESNTYLKNKHLFDFIYFNYENNISNIVYFLQC